MSDKIKVDEKEMTPEEFETYKKETEGKKGVKLVKVNESTYKTRIQGWKELAENHEHPASE